MKKCYNEWSLLNVSSMNPSLFTVLCTGQVGHGRFIFKEKTIAATSFCPSIPPPPLSNIRQEKDG